jgi:uncharacterized membrane protein
MCFKRGFGMKILFKRDYLGLIIAICLLIIWSVVFADATPHTIDYTQIKKSCVDEVLRDRYSSV